MAGTRWWRQPENRLKKCSERRSDSCSDETDGCCAVIACTYCLQWDVYGSESVYGTADFATDGWYGNIAGSQFEGYWQRDYDSGECAFHVAIDGEVVYQKTCYEGQSCRDSSDSTETTINYEAGTLSWTKIEPRPLPYVVDAETGCRTWFCGDCECSCECLCVTITDGYSAEVCHGELCDTAYSDCEGPVWAGTIGCAGTEYVLSLALAADSYGNCVLVPTVNGDELESVSVSGCSDLQAVIVLDDGTTIEVECKTCCCNCVTGEACCDDRCLPSEDCGNPLPNTLTVELTGTPSYGSDTCFDGSGTITFKTPAQGGLNCWEGEITGTCLDCNGATFNWSMYIRVCCSGDGQNSFNVAYYGSDTPCTGFSDTTVQAISCDPLLLQGCFPEVVADCFVGCLDDVTPIDPPDYTVCFSIYETP